MPTDSTDLYPATSDLQAVDEVVRGNSEMFEVLVRRYNQQLFRVGLGYLRHREPVEDAMQNTYLKAFVNLPRFQRRSSFSTWLTRIMINECLMVLRPRRHVVEEALTEEATRHEATPPQGAARMNLKEMGIQLEKALDGLPRNLRAVYLLRDVQQMTTAETAACLGVSAANVKVSLHRARERMKTALLNNATGMELFQYRAEFCDPFTARIMHVVLGGA